MARPTGYEPLGEPKPFGQQIWTVDGPVIRFYGIPFPTRMTVVRMADGGLWLHSPIAVSDDLLARVQALGPIRHLVAPNWIHYAYVHGWQGPCPDAVTWAAPGVAERAASRDVPVRVDHVITNDALPPWQDEIAARLVTGSRVHREVVFFHHASRTLILTDLIENFDPRFAPWWLGWLLRLAGITVPDGRIPPDMAATFRRNRAELCCHIRWMLDQDPARVVLSHGHCYEDNAVPRLRRAFRSFLED